MTKMALVFILVALVVSPVLAQKSQGLEAKITRLAKTVDSLKSSLVLHEMLYRHADIELNSIRSRLALELNRNFVYYASIHQGDSDFKDDKGIQRVYRFFGYHSRSQFTDIIKGDRTGYLRLVRKHVKSIAEIIALGKVEPQVYGGFTDYPNRAIIVFFDNSESDEVLIEADSHLKTLKVRLDGVLQDVGWE